MTCAEFQKVLPYIIETGGNAEEEKHLRECPICADLVQDLKYIAEQAKLLVPMEDPSPQVWEGIREGLQREGLVKPARARGRLLGIHGSIPWLGVAAVLVLIVAGIAVYQRAQSTRSRAAEAAVVPADISVQLDGAVSEQQDQQIVSLVADTRTADVAGVYAAQLKRLNAAIQDARRSLQQNPNDDDARQLLRRAYEQKAMLYDMATRSLR